MRPTVNEITQALNTTIRSQEKLVALIRLTRWREHVPFTTVLVICGALLAVHLRDVALDWRIVPVVIANILAMSFAFMINDVADAPDDALNPKKKLHNVISSGLLTPREGMFATWLTFIVALALYALGGAWTFVLGGITLILCYLYSAYPWRLKARPITDVVSHALMLSGLLVMTGFFTYNDFPGIVWYVIIAAILFSAYGQFYNQIDDYEVDKAAGLKNTVVLLGKRPTTALMYLSLVGAFACMAVAIVWGAFPAWLGTVLVIAILAVALFTWETDMRGNAAEGSGAVQKPVLLVANIVMLLWLVQEAGWLALL